MQVEILLNELQEALAVLMKYSPVKISFFDTEKKLAKRQENFGYEHYD